MQAATLKDIAKKMAKLDICMFNTSGLGGALEARPMSNNGDVEYDGNSYFFTWHDSGVATQIEANNQVSLNFNGEGNLYITINGNASIVKDKEKMREHWVDSLNQWFEDGIDTAGVVMIHVTARHIRYWRNEEMGEWGS